jgi:hypothetical protein
MTRVTKEISKNQDGESDSVSFIALLAQEFPRRDPVPTSRIDEFIKQLAAEAFEHPPTVGTGILDPLYAMREAINQKIADQIAHILRHPDLRGLETAWRGLMQLAIQMPGARIRVLNMPDADRLRIIETSSNAAIELKGGGLGAILPIEEGTSRLNAMAVDEKSTDWINSPLLGTGGMARKLDVARATLDNWRKGHHALAFRKGIRNFVYPTRQFGRSAPVEGLKYIRFCFSDDEEAWEWLVEPNRLTAGNAPIDWLHLGRTEDVIRAAEGALDYQ